MDGSVSISLGTIFGVVAFIFQIGLTIGAIAFSHGSLNQRVRAIEEEVKEHSRLSNSVTRLEAELEAVGREIKGLRDDFRRVLEEFARPRSYSGNRDGRG